jgi:hypothetical protein
MLSSWSPCWPPLVPDQPRHNPPFVRPAQPAAPAPAPPPPLPLHEGSAEFAFVGTTGNSSTQTIVLTFKNTDMVTAVALVAKF